LDANDDDDLEKEFRKKLMKKNGSFVEERGKVTDDLKNEEVLGMLQSAMDKTHEEVSKKAGGIKRNLVRRDSSAGRIGKSGSNGKPLSSSFAPTSPTFGGARNGSSSGVDDLDLGSSAAADGSGASNSN
jgi:hypothetical protein